MDGLSYFLVKDLIWLGRKMSIINLVEDSICRTCKNVEKDNADQVSVKILVIVTTTVRLQRFQRINIIQRAYSLLVKA